MSQYKIKSEKYVDVDVELIDDFLLISQGDCFVVVEPENLSYFTTVLLGYLKVLSPTPQTGEEEGK